MAWVNRFIENCKRDAAFRMTGELTADELKRSEVELFRRTQQSEFQDEYKALVNRRPLPSNSKLLSLKPKLDDDGLIRSDGRLTNAKYISYDVRHPVAAVKSLPALIYSADYILLLVLCDHGIYILRARN